MVLKDELNIPYEDAALLIEHLEQVCNKAEVITKRMERNVQEIKLSIEIERNMLALAQREGAVHIRCNWSKNFMITSKTPLWGCTQCACLSQMLTSLVTQRTSFMTDVFPLHHQILEFM